MSCVTQCHFLLRFNPVPECSLLWKRLASRWKFCCWANGSQIQICMRVLEREADLDEGVEVPFPEIFIPR